MKTSQNPTFPTLTGLALATIAVLGLTLSGCEENATANDGDEKITPASESTDLAAATPEFKGSSSAPAVAPAATRAEVKGSSSVPAVAPAATAATLTSKDKALLKEKLTPLQYQVAVENGTERSFENEYWDNKAPGIYVDIVSGKALFASNHKFKSGTGWPSFFQPLDPEEVVELSDSKHGMMRTEVRSKTGDIHLGHVFNDGPQPTGLRYCLNSAAMRFVPKEKLKEEGLEQYAELFED